MFFRLLMLMTVVPILELMTILKVHGLLSASQGSSNAFVVTVGTIVLTGVVGAKLARSQGLKTLVSIQEKLQKGELPTDAMVAGVLILLGGALLLTPGYLTDFFGLSLLFPLTRRFYIARVKKSLEQKIASGQMNFSFGTNNGGGFNTFYYSSRGARSPFDGMRSQNAGSHRVSQHRDDPDVIDVTPIDD